MVKYWDEVQCIRAQRIQDRVPYCVDTEISPPNPESWSRGIPEQAFSEGDEFDARM